MTFVAFCLPRVKRKSFSDAQELVVDLIKTLEVLSTSLRGGDITKASEKIKHCKAMSVTNQRCMLEKGEREKGALTWSNFNQKIFYFF